MRSYIFAHQDFFCVYEALAHIHDWYDYVYFNSASSSIQWVVSLLQWLTKLSVLNVSHNATMNNKTSVKLNWRRFKNRSMIGRIESVHVQSD